VRAVAGDLRTRGPDRLAVGGVPGQAHARADGADTVGVAELVRENFSLTPAGMIKSLNLRRPIYQKTAAFGHFGRTEDSFTWETTDKVEALRDAAQLTAAAV